MPPSNRITAFIDANPRGFRRGISQAQRSMENFKRSIAGIVTVAGIVGLARGFEEVSKNAIRAGDSIGKAAKVANLGAEALQEYRFAAILTGSSQKELDDAVGRFTRRLGEARRGNKEYEKTFRELGVEITDTNEQAIDKVFRSLADVEDITVRTALATKVFGDDARRMALLVRDGAGAIDRMKGQARELGIILGDETIASLEGANDKLSIFELQLSTKLATTVANNVEGIVRFAEALNNLKIAAVNAGGAIGNFLSRLDLQFVEAELRLFEILNDEQRAGLSPEALAKFDALRAQREQIEGSLAGVDQADFSTVTVGSIQRSLNGALPVAPDLSGVKIPTAPTLKADALANVSEEAQSAIQRFIEETRTPLEELELKLENIAALRPFAQSEEASEALSRAAEQALEDMASLERATEGWRIASERAGDGIAEAFAGAIAFGDDLGKTLERLTQQLAFEGLLDIFRGALGLETAQGGVFNLIFGGARAAGGPVQPGRAFLVGEQGPELFVPGASGSIIANDDLGAGGVVINQTLRFDVGLESVEQRIAETTPAIAASVVSAVDRARRRPRFA